MSAYSYEQNMETEKLMQNNDGTLNTNQTLSDGQKCENGVGVNGQVNGDVNCSEKCNGGGVGGDLTKAEMIEMSTSTTSVKCCNGIFKPKNKQKMCVKENQNIVVGNGSAPSSNGKCYFNTLKAKLSSNGKYQVNGDVECGAEKPCKKVKKEKQPCVFDDRDPFKINSNVKFEFLNIFAEPNSGTYSCNPTWSFTSRMYFNVKLFIYRLFSILIGIPCAFICAIIFALFSVFQIWIFMPLLRMFKAIFGLIREIWFVIIDTVFGPIFQLFTVCIRPSYRNSSDSQCPSSASSKSIYNEDVNVV